MHPPTHPSPTPPSYPPLSCPPLSCLPLSGTSGTAMMDVDRQGDDDVEEDDEGEDPAASGSSDVDAELAMIDYSRLEPEHRNALELSTR